MTLSELLLIDVEGGLSRVVHVYDNNDQIVTEYKTIPQPTIDVTECLKRSYLYNNAGDRMGEQAKVSVWTQELENLVSPEISNITISNSSILPGLPSGTKIADITVTGGVVPLTITLSSNPDNLFRIDNGDDLVLNAPSTSGAHAITIQVTDDDGKTESQNFTIDVLSFSNLYSLQFDGVDERVDFGTNPNFCFERTTPFSASGWFKVSATAVTMQIIGTQSINANPRGWAVKTDTTKAVIFILSATSSNQIVVKTTTFFTDGLWHSFVVTYSGSSAGSGVKIYVDGVNQAVTITSDNLSTSTVNTNSLRAGCSSDTTAQQFFAGNLDELSIWNKELSAGEVTSIHNSGHPGNLNSHSAVANLIHWYRMGDGDTFPVISDQKGSNNGTCVNMEALDIKLDTP